MVVPPLVLIPDAASAIPESDADYHRPAHKRLFTSAGDVGLNLVNAYTGSTSPSTTHNNPAARSRKASVKSSQSVVVMIDCSTSPTMAVT